MIAFCFKADPFFCIASVHSVSKYLFYLYYEPATVLGQIKSEQWIFLILRSLEFGRESRHINQITEIQGDKIFYQTIQ